jgi:hypothetical protein
MQQIVGSNLGTSGDPNDLIILVNHIN